MEVVLHVLSMFLSASRSRVTEQTHQMVHSSQSSSTNSVTVNERDEFCNNYISLQESAAIQMLIETCLTQESDKVCGVISFQGTLYKHHPSLPG